MDGFSSATAVIGLLDAAIRGLGRLRTAYVRVKDAPKVFDAHTCELEEIKSLVAIVEDEPYLQSANVRTGVDKLKTTQEKLMTCLKTMEKGSKNAVAQFSHKLFHGSREEEHLSSVMKELCGARMNILLHIQLCLVGVKRDKDNKVVAKLDEIMEINAVLVDALGDSCSLRIAVLLKNRPPRPDGTIVLTAEDVAYVTGKSEASSVDKTIKTERVIVGNMTQDQAVQINGPVGEDMWKDITRLEIRDNRAIGKSIQVNYAMSREDLKDIWSRQRDNIEDERRENASRLRPRTDSAISLDDSD